VGLVDKHKFCSERHFPLGNKRQKPNTTKKFVLNSTVAVNEQYRRKQKIVSFF